MSATGHVRGHEIEWDGDRDCWVFVDTGEATPGWGGAERPCHFCGLTAEPGGPDPCLGWIEGVHSACCGHGVAEGWIGWDDACAVVWVGRNRSDARDRAEAAGG